ncbi:hypothetical protein AB833_04730 [Chromatiales bacterium (ex Bugula neritina AB1)]|nr:hypothetical protein AB833_04730 [Chromatiales bacterium (ex Bugula neritina AB1)]
MTAPMQPHRLPSDTTQLMQTVILALLPGIAVFLYQTGWGGVLNLCIATTAACLAEAFALRLRQRNWLEGLSDYSAIITGLLIGLCLPPLIAWWIPALAAAFAILLAKHAYGGLGNNVFNPAMAGYALILVSFPRDLGIWLSQPDAFGTPLRFVLERVLNGGLVNYAQWDALTGATALDLLRERSISINPLPDNLENLSGSFGAKHSEWQNLAYLAGGLWLLHKRIINWQIPVLVIASLSVCVIIETLASGSFSLPALGLHTFGGATILCAFFIATDPVSAAATKRGQLLYAGGIGLLLYLIRAYGGYPDGVAFAVLLMNCCVPLIDRIDLFFRSGTGRTS